MQPALQLWVQLVEDFRELVQGSGDVWRVPAIYSAHTSIQGRQPFVNLPLCGFVGVAVCTHANLLTRVYV